MFLENANIFTQKLIHEKPAIPKSEWLQHAYAEGILEEYTTNTITSYFSKPSCLRTAESTLSGQQMTASAADKMNSVKKPPL